MREETSPPWQSPDLQIPFRGLPGFSNDENALRDVAIVGALFDLKGNMLPDDSWTIKNTFKQLADAGIRVHTDSRFYFYNLLPPVSSDFLAINNGLLRDPIPSDLLITCGICNSHPGRYNTWDRMPENRKIGFTDFSNMYGDYEIFPDRYVNRATAISRFQCSEIWQKCAENIGAKIIVARGGYDEVNSEMFEGDIFQNIIHTNENFAKEYGIIGGSLGILMKTGYAQTLRAVFNRKSMLGARAYDASKNLTLKKFEKTGKYVMRLA